MNEKGVMRYAGELDGKEKVIARILRGLKWSKPSRCDLFGVSDDTTMI